MGSHAGDNMPAPSHCLGTSWPTWKTAIEENGQRRRSEAYSNANVEFVAD